MSTKNNKKRIEGKDTKEVFHMNGTKKQQLNKEDEDINKFIDILKKSINKRVRVTMEDGRVIKGLCIGVNYNYLNFIIRNPSDDEGTVYYPIMIIRGNAIITVEVLE